MNTERGVEVWKPIIGYEGFYEVSSTGRVRNMNGRIKSQRMAGNGYLRLSLYKPGGHERHYTTSRLVAAAFIGTCPEGFQVNHIDGNKTNNHVDNLEYVTPQQNTLHAIRLGMRPIYPEVPDERRPRGANHFSHKHPERRLRGVSHGMAKLNDEDVKTIRRMLADGVKGSLIAAEFGVTASLVTSIKYGRSWKHLR